MKLTWFGGTALRVYLGGQIVVIDPDSAASSVNRGELRSGADRVVELGDSALPRVAAENWSPPRPGRAIDAPRDLEVLTIGPQTCLLCGEGDPPLLASDASELPRLGRWADGAVIVLFGDRGAQVGEAILTHGLAAPRHLLLAAEERVVDDFVTRIANRLRDLSFSSLEPGLALEV